MTTHRVEFKMPFRPKIGVPVMNNMAEEVGVVVDVVLKPEILEDGTYQYTVRADVRESSGTGYQVFEPSPIREG